MDYEVTTWDDMHYRQHVRIATNEFARLGTRRVAFVRDIWFPGPQWIAAVLIAGHGDWPRGHTEEFIRGFIGDTTAFDNLDGQGPLWLDARPEFDDELCFEIIRLAVKRMAQEHPARIEVVQAQDMPHGAWGLAVIASGNAERKTLHMLVEAEAFFAQLGFDAGNEARLAVRTLLEQFEPDADPRLSGEAGDA